MLQMSKEEVYRSYKGAKSKKEQVQILADLNETTKAEIIDTLIEFGVPKEELPGKAGRPPKKKEPTEKMKKHFEKASHEVAKVGKEKTKDAAGVILHLDRAEVLEARMQTKIDENNVEIKKQKDLIAPIQQKIYELEKENLLI